MHNYTLIYSDVYGEHHVLLTQRVEPSVVLEAFQIIWGNRPVSILMGHTHKYDNKEIEHMVAKVNEFVWRYDSDDKEIITYLSLRKAFGCTVQQQVDKLRKYVEQSNSHRAGRFMYVALQATSKGADGKVLYTAYESVGVEMKITMNAVGVVIRSGDYIIREGDASDCSDVALVGSLIGAVRIEMDRLENQALSVELSTIDMNRLQRLRTYAAEHAKNNKV